MKFRLGQDLIDFIRKKQNMKSKFLDKVLWEIKRLVPYNFEETKEDYLSIPDRTKKYWIQTNVFFNYKLYKYYKIKLLDEYNIKELELAYGLLSDEFSKKMFINVLLYQLFEEVHFRYPLFYSDVFNFIDEIEKNACSHLKGEIVPEGHLKVYDLTYFNYKNLKLLYGAQGIVVDYILQQYNYKNYVKVEKGDVVIDGGGCYGDTALYFSYLAGETGRVHSFEFIDSNIDIYNKNLMLNPKLSKNITLVRKPLWESSTMKLYTITHGAASHVSFVPLEEGAVEFTSISIDDYVRNNNMQKIDFIKLDIEGSEIPTIKGAQETIKKFKPKLAICVYHRKEDLWEIPILLKSFVPEYRLFLNHYTLHSGETVLFAIA